MRFLWSSTAAGTICRSIFRPHADRVKSGRFALTCCWQWCEKSRRFLPTDNLCEPPRHDLWSAVLDLAPLVFHAPWQRRKKSHLRLAVDLEGPVAAEAAGWGVGAFVVVEGYCDLRTLKTGGYIPRLRAESARLSNEDAARGLLTAKWIERGRAG